MEKIFLDNASTTKIDSEVNDLIAKTNLVHFYNPSAMYHESIEIKDKIENAQKTMAKILNVNSENIIWTSGATESNNLANIFSLVANTLQYTTKQNTLNKKVQ